METTIQNWTIQNPYILSGFKMVFDKMAAICLDFRSHLKSGQFEIQTSPDCGPHSIQMLFDNRQLWIN